MMKPGVILWLFLKRLFETVITGYHRRRYYTHSSVSEGGRNFTIDAFCLGDPYAYGEVAGVPLFASDAYV